MIREEYLNPEFMYKIMNSFCKRDGYILQHFTFGQLKYQKDCFPVLLTDNHGYSIVYKMILGKFSEKSYEEFKNSTSIRCSDIQKLYEQKTVYFDIYNEILLDDKMFKGKFVEFPPFFTVGGQIYYAIYNQPNVLKEHYSRGREEKIFQDYCNYMDIDEKNLFSPMDIAHNNNVPYHIKSNSFQVTDWEQLRYILTKPKRSCFAAWLRTEGYSRCKPKASCKEFPFWKLHIHRTKFPVFYTANVLELTVPIVECLNELSSRVNNSLNGIEQLLSYVVFNIKMTMSEHLTHIYHNAYKEAIYHNIWVIERGLSELTVDPSQSADKLIQAPLDSFKHRTKQLDESLSATRESIKMSSLRKLSKLNDDFQKLTADNISLNRTLELENNLIMLMKKEE